VSDETDHDILIEVRSDVKHLIEKHEELKEEFHKECLPRLTAVENQQLKWIGRDGAIVAGISMMVTLICAKVLRLF
jgi:DNA-directed RNA polymerase subunit H (RpoH/RPB5)